jgi:phosphatidylinositol alpha-1,6-mannosyltransferase
MDILVISWNYPPRRGGIENLLENLCSGLREEHRVFIITSFAKKPYPNERDTFRAPVAGLIPFAVYALWRGAMVLARSRRIGVVFGGSALTTPLVLILSRPFRRRAVVLIHGLDVIHPKFIYQLLCVRWLKFCDRVIANSNYTAALAESRAVAPKRLTVIPPGVQPDRFNISTDVIATKRRWNIEDRKIILFVGRLAKRKGLKEFVETSLVEIIRQIPETVFLIIGDNPTDSLAHHHDVVEEINTLASKSGLENRVRLLGAVSDDEKIRLYQACDVVVLPALDLKEDVEGFGIVALEGAAAGKPIVAMRVGGIPDAVEDGKGGILVDPGDYRALTRAVNAILNDAAKGFAIGFYARERTKRDFSWNQIIAAYGQMLTSFDDASK